eukprot:129321-Alexandrium_andersonii.AAC.1
MAALRRGKAPQVEWTLAAAHGAWAPPHAAASTRANGARSPGDDPTAGWGGSSPDAWRNGLASTEA